MSKSAFTIALMSVALLGCTSNGIGIHSKEASRCPRFSRNTEVYAFYGPKDTVIENLANIPVKLAERRVFLQITQGDSRSEAKLFEQKNDGTFSVTTWRMRKSGRLLAEIDEAILGNQGVNCVGEQVRAVLEKQLQPGTVTNGVSAPASTRAAFAHSVKAATGEFVRSIVYIMC